MLSHCRCCAGSIRRTAHRLAIQGLKLLPPGPGRGRERCEIGGAGVRPEISPIRSAWPAGFDKSAEVPDALLRLGFGFVEIGNRDAEAAGRQSAARDCFRLERDEAVDQSHGVSTMTARRAVLLRLAAGARSCGGIVGVNVGAKQGTSADRVGRLCQADRDPSSRWRATFTVNVYLAEHAGPAQPCSRPRPSTICWPRVNRVPASGCVSSRRRFAGCC